MITISSDVIRGYNDTIILYLLLDRPSYGYEISRMIRSLSDGKYIIKETTLYSAFTRVLQGEVRGVEPDQRSDRALHLTDRQARSAGSLTRNARINIQEETSWIRSEII